MKHDAACWKPGRIAPAIATIFLSGCAAAGSDHGACPPIVGYPRAFQARVAAEVEALPPSAAIEVMLADYAVLRAQARACAGR